MPKKEIVIDLGPAVAWCRKQGDQLWTRLMTENLLKRIVKCVIGTTLTVIIVVSPGVGEAFGAAAYLAAFTTVFGHPGRRFGAMIEVLALGAFGALCGIAWSSLGIYVSGLAKVSNPAAYRGIRATMLAIGLFIHGIVRSIYPRLFFLALLFVIVCTVGMTGPLAIFESWYVTQFLYPIFTAIGVMILVNVAVFPEFGSTHLGLTTISSLQNILQSLRGATNLFILGSSSQNLTSPDMPSTIDELVSQKAKLREMSGKCKAVYQESTFELAYACIGPKELKPIAVKKMKKLVGNVVALIGACESRFALIKPDEEAEAMRDGGAETPRTFSEKKGEKASDDLLDLLRPKREIEFGSEQLLRYLLRRIKDPLMDFQSALEKAIDIITLCVAYAYDVEKLPARQSIDKKQRVGKPKGVLLEELDIHVEWLDSMIQQFSRQSTEALEGAAVVQGDIEADVLPRDEIFLISSFLLNMQQAAQHIHEMLLEARHLVEIRHIRNEKPRLHLPIFKFHKWLTSGNEEGDGTLHTKEERDRVRRKSVSISDSDSDNERVRAALDDLYEDEKTWTVKVREVAADCVDWVRESPHFMFAAKLMIGAFSLCWPAFVNDQWNQWYYDITAVWCPIVFIVVFQDVVGSTIWVFFLRAVGTVAGATWGLAAYEARNGNPIVIVVMLAIGFFPSFFIQIGTQYQKAGIVLTISMVIVAVGTYLQPERGSSKENFTKRTLALLIGGTVALIVHTIFFPVKSRVSLIDSLASSLRQLMRMESCIAAGIDQRSTIISSSRLQKKFSKAAKKCEGELKRAEENLGYVDTEPRLKGDFAPQIAIYTEIIFVIHQILERMENLLSIRRAYGSIVLEEFTSKIYVYRRNVAAAITVTLYAVQEALLTKSPLPQFLPSARLAHMRMIIKVRQLLMEDAAAQATSLAPALMKTPGSPLPHHHSISSPELSKTASAQSPPPPQTSTSTRPTTPLDPLTPSQLRSLRLRILSWNASAAALEECIEYVEELVDLTKTLFGAFEFRSGMLMRQTYRGHVMRIRKRRFFEGKEDDEGASRRTEWGKKEEGEERGEIPRGRTRDTASTAAMKGKSPLLAPQPDPKAESSALESTGTRLIRKLTSAATGNTGASVNSHAHGQQGQGEAAPSPVLAPQTSTQPIQGRVRSNTSASASEVTMPVLERMRSRRQAAREDLKRQGTFREHER